MTSIYPPGEVTRYGRELLLNGSVPQISYTSADRQRIFHLQGGLAPTLGVQDGVALLSIKGMSPPFKHLVSQGAREDGSTWNDAVYEPLELDMVVEAGASTPAGLSQVVADWVAAWDPKIPGRLEWFTPESGLWWADTRLFDTWPDEIKQSPRQHRKQIFTHTAKSDKAFWHGPDSCSMFAFAYEDMTDTTFGGNRIAQHDLGANWPQYYYGGTGGGYCYSDGQQARWQDDPADPFTTAGRSVTNGPRAGFNTATDNQVVSIVLGSIPEITFPDAAENHIWGRMGRTGSAWDGNGIRVAIGFNWLVLSRFNSFTETVMFQRPLFFPPLFGEKFTLVCGQEGKTRQFLVLRNGFQILKHTETGTASVMNSSHRGVGFGMRTGAALITQATPASVRKISGGDNSTVTQEGFLNLTNIGDQDGWPKYLLYGPASMVQIGNGPGSTDMIKFGPILDGQIVLIDTHPRLRSVVDLTFGDVTPGLTPVQSVIDTIIKLVTFQQVPPLLTWFESLFGITPPQGVLYSLLQGRFTRPLPAVPDPTDAATSKMKVTIDGGNASSKVVAALTPQRRWPE